MTALRQIRPVRILLAGACMVALLLFARTQFRPSSVSQVERPAAARWDKWHALTAAERASLVAAYQRIKRRGDARRVFDSADAFAALTVAQQVRLRDLNELVEEVIRAQPADRRRWLNSLPGTARAVELYRLIKQDYPERLRGF